MPSCQQLAGELAVVESLLQHVVADDARARLIHQIGQIQAQQEAAGCLAHTTRTLNGIATLWTDNSQLPGPKSRPIMITLTIYDVTGDVIFTFNPLTFGSVTIEQRPGGTQRGQFSAQTGALSLWPELLVKNIPLLGDQELDAVMSTGDRITLPSRMTISGQPVGPDGQTIVVGQGTISALVTVTASPDRG